MMSPTAGCTRISIKDSLAEPDHPHVQKSGLEYPNTIEWAATDQEYTIKMDAAILSCGAEFTIPKGEVLPCEVVCENKCDCSYTIIPLASPKQPRPSIIVEP